jgi:hypothetical protein
VAVVWFVSREQLPGGLGQTRRMRCGELKCDADFEWLWELLLTAVLE